MVDYRNEILPWIGRTAKMIDYYHTRKLKEQGFDLTKEQWILLKIVSHHKGVSQNELACLSERDKTSMTRLVNTMEKKNLIARIPSSDDKRINLLYLTTQGEKMLMETSSVVEALMHELKEGLSQEEISVIISGLKKFKKTFKKQKVASATKYFKLYEKIPDSYYGHSGFGRSFCVCKSIGE